MIAIPKGLRAGLGEVFGFLRSVGLTVRGGLRPLLREGPLSQAWFQAWRPSPVEGFGGPLQERGQERVGAGADLGTAFSPRPRRRNPGWPCPGRKTQTSRQASVANIHGEVLVATLEETPSTPTPTSIPIRRSPENWSCEARASAQK